MQVLHIAGFRQFKEKLRPDEGAPHSKSRFWLQAYSYLKLRDVC